jgi:dolichol-phosphate mannosyltransferase
MSNSETLISVCIIIRNERERIKPFLENLSRVVAANYQYYELLVLDNASIDGTDQRVIGLLRTLPNIRLMRLSRIYDLDTAATAALDSAIGDYVILTDLDTDLTIIQRLVEKAQEGNDIVVVRRRLDRLYSPVDRWLGRLLYRIASRLLGYDIVMEDGFMRLFSRRVVNALTQIRSRRRFIRHYGAIVGYRHAYVMAEGGDPIRHVNRVEKINFLVSLVVNNSIRPLRLASLLGLFASILSLLYLLYILFVTVIREGRLAEGWLTTSVTTTTMFLLLFVILSVLAEYIGRLLEETKDEPLYFIEYEDHSTISSYTRTIEQEKLNIIQA